MTDKVTGQPAQKVRAKRWGAESRDRIISVLSPLFCLLLWEIGARIGWIDTRFFPAPSHVFEFGMGLVQDGTLLTNTWVTLKRLFWGFLVGGIPALVIGLVMGLFRPVRAAIEPLIAATYPIPKSAIMPLILLIFGLDEGSKIAMVAIGVFYPIVINTVAGVLEINKIYLEVGRNFRASSWQLFRTVALPGALPFILTGVKLGVGMGLILITIAEMMGAQSGLGYMIWNAWQVLSVETMYVGLFMIAIIGFVLTFALNELERFVIPWKRPH